MNKIDLNDRDFLETLRDESLKEASNTPNKSWVRTYEDLANACDHLDGMIARTEESIK